jgi:uncharacterized SAM-binding protein YcdF (DUF218 family)
MLKRFLITFLVLVILDGTIYIFRAPILRSFALLLIKEDSLQKADALFVLSGAGFERGNEAARVFAKGLVPKIICTGANPEIEFKVFGIDTLESEVTVADLRRLGVPDSAIVKLPEGTSTREEAVVILNYCLANHLKKVIVLSSKLHTRRVNKVFRKKFKDAGITLLVHGAPPLSFDERQWWRDEEGMIAVNNEWMKTFYYWWYY